MRNKFAPALIIVGMTLAACSGSGEATTQTTAAIADPTPTTSGDATTQTTAQPDPGAQVEPTETSVTPTTETPTAPQGGTDFPDEIPPGQEPYYQPFTVDQGDTQVTWDRWFWGLVDGKGIVQVFIEGEVVAEGPISGPDSIMSQDGEGTFFLVNADAAVVATVTQEEMTAAIEQVLEENDIG